MDEISADPPVPPWWAFVDGEQACQGPTTGSKATVGKEDVADGVAMTALPPCVVITYSNGTQEVERGRQEREHRRRGTESSPGDLTTRQPYKACPLSA